MTERSLLIIDLNGVIISLFILNCAICVYIKNLQLKIMRDLIMCNFFLN